MHRFPPTARAAGLAAALAACLAGCAAARGNGTGQGAGLEVLRAAELARVRCLVVAPFENASDAPLAAEAATATLAAGIDPERTRVLPLGDLRAIFRDTPLELPPGISPSLALELAELLGADAALYGAVEGRAHEAGGGAELLVTVRLALAGDRHLLFAATTRASVTGDERPEGAVQRATAALVQPVLMRLGDTGRKRCFDEARVKALREYALVEGRPAAPQLPPKAALDSTSVPLPPPPQLATAPTPVLPAPAGRVEGSSRRSTAWARRLADPGRLVVEDVAFEGRTAELAQDAGLADLARALGASPDLKVRLEGFVDATSEPEADAKLSQAMAQAAARRLVQLGVDAGRLSWAGRGGASPVLPNFTARGRAANRRIEVQALR
ncbi:MAG: OmpA family protein [Anaeromyxobacter sp.]